MTITTVDTGDVRYVVDALLDYTEAGDEAPVARLTAAVDAAETTDPEPDHYWLSVGRNRSGFEAGVTVPLDAGDWHDLQVQVRFAGNLWGTLTGVEVQGTSTWEGVPEDTFLVLVSLLPAFRTQLTGHLSRIAARFDQTAIGFVGGPGGSLVFAEVL